MGAPKFPRDVKYCDDKEYAKDCRQEAVRKSSVAEYAGDDSGWIAVGGTGVSKAGVKDGGAVFGDGEDGVYGVALVHPVGLVGNLIESKK